MEIGGAELYSCFLLAAESSAGVLEPINDWNFDSDAIIAVLKQHKSSLYWLGIVLFLIMTVLTQAILFPLFYRVFKQQATTSIRMAYIFSLLVATIVFHWWLWKWIFVALTKNFWLWLAWGLFCLLWLGLIIWTPKKRLPS